MNEDAGFLEFCSMYNKSYTTALEYDRRKAKWKDSDAKVKALNSINSTTFFDVNATADLEDIEFNEMLGGQIPAFD